MNRLIKIAACYVGWTVLAIALHNVHPLLAGAVCIPLGIWLLECKYPTT